MIVLDSIGIGNVVNVADDIEHRSPKVLERILIGSSHLNVTHTGIEHQIGADPGVVSYGKKSVADIEPFRVLFWLRDLEGVGEDQVFAIPEVVQNATPFIRDWYKDGGSILLWSHATTYVGHLGRLNLDDLKNNDRAIGTGFGGINRDVWKMAVQLNPGSRFSKDHSTHPIFKGLFSKQRKPARLALS